MGSALRRVRLRVPPSLHEHTGWGFMVKAPEHRYTPIYFNFAWFRPGRTNGQGRGGKYRRRPFCERTSFDLLPLSDRAYPGNAKAMSDQPRATAALQFSERPAI